MSNQILQGSMDHGLGNFLQGSRRSPTLGTGLLKEAHGNNTARIV